MKEGKKGGRKEGREKEKGRKETSHSWNAMALKCVRGHGLPADTLVGNWIWNRDRINFVCLSRGSGVSSSGSITHALITNLLICTHTYICISHFGAVTSFHKIIHLKICICYHSTALLY